MTSASIELPPYLPYFETLELFEEGNSFVNEHVATLTTGLVSDAAHVYEMTIDYLCELKHVPNNFKSARSEITTFLIWCWDIEKISVADITRRHMNRFLDWCSSPPAEFIGDAQRASFIYHKGVGLRCPNPLWRPFVNRAKKGSDPAFGDAPYQRKASATKSQLAVLSSYYQYLNDEDYCERNPAMLAMRRDRHKVATSGPDNEEIIKALNPLQVGYLFDAAELMAKENPDRHERTLFLVTLLFSTYARISEVSARPGYAPVMSQIRRDKNGETWGFFIPQSKNGKPRTVALSDALLDALKRYRKHLGLTDLPSPNEQLPLLARLRAAQHGRDAKVLNANLGVNAIREEIEAVYQRAAQLLEQDGREHDAAELRTMTVHSLRHTGITFDLSKGRELTHVMLDAGHQDIGITSRYIGTSRTERYESAKYKGL